MVSPKVTYKGLRKGLRPLLAAGGFLNSRSGLVSYHLPGLSPCTWTISRRVPSFQPGSSSQLFQLHFCSAMVLTSAALIPPPQPKWCVFHKRAKVHPGQLFELRDWRLEGTSRYLRYSLSAPGTTSGAYLRVCAAVTRPWLF